MEQDKQQVTNFNVDDLNFEEVNTDLSNVYNEVNAQVQQAQPPVSSYFDALEADTKSEEVVNAKPSLKGEWGAKIVFRLINGAFNSMVVMKTGRTANELKIGVSDDDKELFGEVISAGIDSGEVKMPHPLAMFVILIIAFYGEAIATMYFYNPDKTEITKPTTAFKLSKLPNINKTEISQSIEKEAKARKRRKADLSKHTKTCAYLKNRTNKCNCGAR